MRTAADFVTEATSGNFTAIDIGAPPPIVWQALQDLRLTDLRATALLMGIRSLPAVVRRKGSLERRATATATPTLLESLTSSRFTTLYLEPDRVLTLGIVGQFWRLTGGDDAAIDDSAAFVDFDEPGFVKSAVDFVLVARSSGTRVTTQTCNRATDETAARAFGRYWRVIGPGSKLIRVDMLRSLRKGAENRHESR